ncbi:hypothetical protein ACIQYS_13910 [Psychrobacillus sp. NPDC096426]|uniref:hypothetical protein n=1 Tax=Psychrobacillus sp. NPDC096426 TaxID=3364491 RepID=UPI003828F292
MNDNIKMFKQFLPQAATILELQQTEKKPAVLVADIDGDDVDELIGAFQYKGKNYLWILKNRNNQWQPLIMIRGSGFGISDLRAVPLTDTRVNTVIIGWQHGSTMSQLNLLQWTKNGFVWLPTNDLFYSKLEVEDMNIDGKFELAIWTHDTGEAYKVEVYRFDKTGLVQAKDVYPYYFRKVAAYYESLLKTNEYSYYWYYLADAQIKEGKLDKALNSIYKALTFPSPYPSKEELTRERQEIQNHQGESNPNNQVVIDWAMGDVTGDGVRDTVYLTGEKTEGSPFWKNITLVILNGKTNVYESIPLKENMGYNPTIFLGDFTGNHVDDIQIVIDTGGSGGTVYSYVFAFLDGKMKLIFDTDAFNEHSKYEVNYENHYRVTITSSNPKKEYTLDLTYKREDYLSEIYNVDGTLKEPIEGWVDPISGLYPIDYARDGTYELLSYQEIAGRYHADALGYVQNEWKWNGREFVSNRQTVSIFGKDLSTS